VVAVSYHLLLDGSERVVRAHGMQALARSIRERVGDGFPLTHVDTPFALQFFLGSTAPLASVEQATRLLSGPDAAFIAVRDLEALERALAPSPVLLFVVAQWPAIGEASVRIVSNHARLEWTADMSAIFDPIVMRTHGVRFLRRRGQEFVVRATGPAGAVVFTNDSRAPQLVRARMLGPASVVVQEHLLAPGDHWPVSVAPARGASLLVDGVAQPAALHPSRGEQVRTRPPRPVASRAGPER
jgi:hypothetical protein